MKRPPVKRQPVKRAQKPPKSDPLVEYRLAISAKSGSGDVEVQVLPLTGEVGSKVKLWVPTGILALDTLLGGEGLPAGRVIEIFGPNHIGKSTILDHIFAAAQRMGGYAILVDAEQARDYRYTRRLGVDVEQLQVIEFLPSELSIENVVNKIFSSCDWWRVNHPESPVVIGWDALGSTSTNEELGKRIGEATVASAAKVMRQACRQVAARVGNTKIMLVVCNHQYEKIGHFGGAPGPKRETYAGEALRLATSVRLELYNAGQLKVGDGTVVGREVGVKLIKHRLGCPGETRIALLYGLGADNVWSIYQVLVGAKFISHPGGSGWDSVNLGGEIGLVKFRGWAGLREKVAEIPELFPRLVEAYRVANPPPAGLLL